MHEKNSLKTKRKNNNSLKTNKQIIHKAKAKSHLHTLSLSQKGYSSAIYCNVKPLRLFQNIPSTPINKRIIIGNI